MTRVLSLLHSLIRARQARGAWFTLALAIVVWGCADKIAGPSTEVPGGRVGVFADLAPAGVTTLVIQVSGPGIVKSNGSPDTLAFNIPLSNGIASGSLDLPAGPDRVITARAFVGLSETHRGSVTATIQAGNNPTLHITLVPLIGNLPLEVAIGSTIVVVRPSIASVAVNDTLRLTAEIRDHNGQVVNDRVRWATLNPIKASVDTLGLVTVRDTGDVQIVGTYGTVGGSTKLTGVISPSVSASHLTWNGNVNTLWAEINNWTPHGLGAARVPSLSDSVVIPAAAPRMPTLQCADDNAVRDIVVEQGATVNGGCGFALNVYGSAVVAGTISTVWARPNARLAGRFQNLYIKGNGVTMIDSVSASYFEVDIPTGTFVFNQKKLRALGDFNVTQGTVTMAAGDTLIVHGNVSWQGGDHNGLLTGGVVISRGNQFYGYRYYGTGTSRLVLDRTATGQQIIGGFDYLNSPNNSQIRRLEIRSRDGANICGHIRVMDTLSLASTGTPSVLATCSSYHVRVFGPVITTSNTDVDNYLIDLRHASGTSLVAGTWHPDITDFSVENAAINPALAYGAVRFFGRNTLPANMTIGGHLYLEGASTELEFAGRKLSVGNYVETQEGATLKMVNAADSLIVADYLHMPDNFHVAQKAKLTAGVITIGAYLEGTGFASSGTKVVMTGTSANTNKYINSISYESRPTQEIHDLEIAADASYGLCSVRLRVHDLIVRAGGRLRDQCSGLINVQNDIVSEPTSTIDPSIVVINSPIGTSHVAGVFSPSETHFTATNAVVKPNLAYQNVRIFAQTTLSGPTAFNGFLFITGANANLTINGHSLTVGNFFQLDNSGTLTMTNAADAVTVTEYVHFSNDNSAAHNTRLTAGTLTVGEHFTGFGFSASGTHKVVLNGASASNQKYINSVNFESRPAQGFQNLEIASGANYGLCERVAVKGTLTVKTGATLRDWCGGSGYIRLDGNMIGETGSTINPTNVMLNSAFGTDNVLGTFAPTFTSIHSPAVVGHLKPGLGYQSMQFFAPVALNASLTVNGDLNVNGPASVVNLNGFQLTVTGNLNMQNSATMLMQNANDVLDVAGNVAWNGGGVQAGKLTNGTTIFRGADVCAQNYETSAAHTTVFNNAGGLVRFRCVSSSQTAQLLSNVTVQGQGVGLECSMNVSGTMTVMSGSTVRQNCFGGTLYVGANLVSASGSTITNGPAYPGSHQMSVLLGNATGTTNVIGAYDAHFTQFTALNPTIKPSLDYKHMELDQSASFSGPTEIDGGLAIHNSAIVNLGGNTVVVKGSMDFNNSARLKMVSSADTLVVGSGDDAADLLWDGGDNSTDGLNPLLTNGAVKFYGDRFLGSQYKPQGSTPHRFIFMSNASGTTSVESSPQFANLEIRGLKALANNSSLTVVKDTMIMGPSTVYGGNNQLQILGDLVTGTSSDLSVATVYVDGPKGTSLVTGRFRPTTALFRNASPIANAIKTGLEYKSVSIQAGQYQLNGLTAFANDLDITSGGRLTINSNTLTVGGGMDVGGSGGGLVMAQSTDVVTVGGLMRFNGGQAGTILSGGTLNVAGSYQMNTDIVATGSHKLVMNGSGARTISSLNGTARALQNLDIGGTGSVSLGSGVVVNGTVNVVTPVTVTGSNSTFNGSFITTGGSSFTHSNLTLTHADGTNLVGGTLSITGTVSFDAAGSQTIRAGAGISYANMSVSSEAVVSGGSLTVPGTLTIVSGGELDVPTGSALGAVTVNGRLDFLGSSLSTNTLTINSGGVATAHGNLSPTVFIDFGRIALNTGGTLETGDRSFGNGGFRYKTAGSPSGFLRNGSVFGPDPVGQP